MRNARGVVMGGSEALLLAECKKSNLQTDVVRHRLKTGATFVHHRNGGREEDEEVDGVRLRGEARKWERARETRKVKGMWSLRES